MFGGVEVFFLPGDHVEDDFVGLFFGCNSVCEVVIGLKEGGFFAAFFMKNPVGFGFEGGLANERDF